MSDRADDAVETDSDDSADMPTVAAAVLQALAVGLADLRARLAVPEPHDVAGLHGLRVTLRRVRTVLAVIDRAAPSPAVERLRAGLAAVARVVGAARDWDVFVTDTLPKLAPAPTSDGFVAVAITAARLRDAAHAAVDGCRHGLETGHTLAHFADLVARGGWPEPGSSLGGAPLDALARPTLDRLHTRALKRGRRLARQDADARHQLRLAVKRLRYAVDLFAPVLDGDGQAGYRRRLVALQDALGRGNDRATARRLAETLAAATDHPDVPAALATLHRALDAADAAEEEHLRTLWRRFRHRQTFWRDER